MILWLLKMYYSMMMLKIMNDLKLKMKELPLMMMNEDINAHIERTTKLSVASISQSYKEISEMWLELKKI